MVSILITLLIACIVVGIVYWIVTLLPLPPPFKQVAMVVCLLVLLIWVLNIFGVWGPTWHVGIR